jgi:hypothetical protein
MSPVIPVPAGREARTDFGLQRVRLHARALDRELERLARGNYRSAGQWASRAAVPIVRTVCITRYLAVAADCPAVTAEERRRRWCLDQAREELRSALSATARSLTRLSDPAIGMAERREVLAELPAYLTQQRRILGTLNELFDQVKLHLVTELIGAFSALSGHRGTSPASAGRSSGASGSRLWACQRRGPQVQRRLSGGRGDGPVAGRGGRCRGWRRPGAGRPGRRRTSRPARRRRRRPGS